MHDLERERTIANGDWLRYARLTCDTEGVYSVRALGSNLLPLVRELSWELMPEPIGVVELSHALSLGQAISWGCCVRRDERDPSFRAELVQALLKLVGEIEYHG
jgi:hypothetical protein